VIEGTPVVGRPAERTGALDRIKDSLKHLAHAGLAPLVRLLAWAGIGPDALTVLGLVFSIFAGLAFFEGGFRLGSLLLLFAGLCDILDGELARTRNRVSKFGAFLDSTLDRLAEAMVLLGISGFYVFNLLELIHDPSRVIEELSRGLEPRTYFLLSLTATAALIGSFMVSYTRARAEGLGLECKVGWFERPERLLLILIAGLFGISAVMPWALVILTILSFATAAQRVAHVWKNTRSR
jgi:CDP-diacylglycerol--glycerol-3-phosphate 3-phosphatidyltransferase